MEDKRDIFNNDGNEDEKNIFSRNLKKLVEPIQQEGFREGVAAGKEEIFQKGFDQGYENGFQAGLRLGIYDSVVRTLQNKMNEAPSDLDATNLAPFENPTRGLCHICTNKGVLLSRNEIESNLDKSVNVPLRTVIEKQKCVFDEVVREKELAPDYLKLVTHLNLDNKRD